MKTNKFLLVGVAVTAGFTLSNSVRAQLKPETDDGIAASPKMRQRLEEQNAHRTASNHLVVVAKPAPVESAIAASPKMSQRLAEQGAGMNRNADVASTPSTTAAPKDGIAASPRMRQWLDERGPQFQIAPIK